MSLKILFAGTPEFAVSPFKALLQSSHTIIAAYTQPDRPAGRGRLLHESPIKQLAVLHNIPVFQPKSLRDPEEQAFLKNLNPDLMVVAAYGLILPKAILEIPKYRCINIHASLLPRWRGASPIQQAILAGDPETGISIMQMDAGLDTGDVLSMHACPITAEDTSQTLHDKLAVLGSEALIAILNDMETKKLSLQKQNDSLASHAPKISKEDAKIDWSENAVVLDRKIRAFNPWPIAFTNMGDQVIRIWKAIHIENDSTSNSKPGVILNTSEAGIDVATGKGILRILELQLAGGKRLAVAEILKSKHALFLENSAFSF